MVIPGGHQDVVRALEGVGVDVQAVEVSEDGARVAVRATPADTIPRARAKRAIREPIQAALPTVGEVVVALGPPAPAAQAPTPSALPGVQNVICVGSGKGGVGKSTMTANLAAALARDGHRVGVIDADVYGYSIPRMLGIEGEPPAPRRRAHCAPALAARRRRHVDRGLPSRSQPVKRSYGRGVQQIRVNAIRPI